MKARMIVVNFTLLFLLSLLFSILAEAVEIGYDDGSAEEGWAIGSAYKVGVMFTQNNLPYSHNLLNSVNIYAAVNNSDQQLKIYFLDSSFNEIHAPIFTPPLQLGTGWKNIDVSSYGIVIDNTFLIGLQWVNTNGVHLGYDKNNFENNGHSYDYNTTKWPEPFWGSPPDPTGNGGDYGIWMIRVDVTPAPPVADAGPDQAITGIGETVHLDGSQSYDPNGYDINYQWTWISWPGSGANPHADPPTLNNADPVKPTFVAGANGIYSLQLVVSNSYSSSAPDTVVVSFNNVSPVANAGGNQIKVLGDTVLLDGYGSSDANHDSLTYQWSLVTKPAGSNASLNATTAQASFIVDLPTSDQDLYVVSLTVSDGIASNTQNVAITVLTKQDAATENLASTVDVVNSLPPETLPTFFVNSNQANALTSKINAALKLIDQKQYAAALDKLETDILPKTDGCATQGAPDKNDWIKDCPTQKKVYDSVKDTIELLQGLQ
jgi:K319L-like, PKD domain